MYYLSVLDPSGVVIDRFSDWSSLESRRIVNGVGHIVFTLNAAHPAVESIQHLHAVRLYRAEPRLSLPYTVENFGVILSREWRLVNRIPYLTCTAVHPNFLLATRVVDYRAGTAGRSSFQGVPAETIAKALVTYNATALAGEDAGRLRDGFHTLLPLAVQPDAAAGPLLDWYCAFSGLLSTLSRLTRVGAGDFDVDQALTFRWYPGQLGADRSSDVIFSLERGNLANPVYTVDRRAEKTVAVVGGIGEGALRQVVHAYSPDYAPSNDVEVFVHGFQASTYEGLEDVGERDLVARAARPRLTFDILQLPSCTYGVHYFLGDRVTVRNPFTRADYLAKVTEIIITHTESGESVAVRLDTGAAGDVDQIPELVSDIAAADTSILDAVDGGAFTTPSSPFFIDAAAFTASYAIPGVYGGYFTSPPG